MSNNGMNWNRVRAERSLGREPAVSDAPPERVPSKLSVRRQREIEANVRRRLGKR